MELLCVKVPSFGGRLSRARFDLCWVRHGNVEGRNRNLNLYCKFGICLKGFVLQKFSHWQNMYPGNEQRACDYITGILPQSRYLRYSLQTIPCREIGPRPPRPNLHSRYGRELDRWLSHSTEPEQWAYCQICLRELFGRWRPDATGTISEGSSWIATWAAAVPQRRILTWNVSAKSTNSRDFHAGLGNVTSCSSVQ